MVELLLKFTMFSKTTNLLTGSALAGLQVKAYSHLKDKAEEVITDDFLTMFAEVVKPHWNLLAPYIVSNNYDVTEENILQQLQTWKEKETPTYGDLYEILKHLIINPVVSQKDGRSKGTFRCNLTYYCTFSMYNILMSYCR